MNNLKNSLIEFTAQDARDFKYNIVLSELEIEEYHHIINDIKENLACGEISSIWMRNKDGNNYDYLNLSKNIKNKLILNGFKIKLIDGSYKIFWRDSEE